MNCVTIALAKGRLAEFSIELLTKCGLDLSSLKEETRKLVLYDASGEYRFLFVKPTDVPTYVEYGVADFGIVGKDTLLEAGMDFYEMLDLKFGACKICVAGYKDFKQKGSKLIVATKYVNVAKEYYNSLGKDIEIIKLNGSVELAPIIGLSDVIVDIVESGKTLKENGLSVLEDICESSARLVINKVSFKTKSSKILPLVEKMKKIIK